jgi:hypothetical protein
MASKVSQLLGSIAVRISVGALFTVCRVITVQVEFCKSEKSVRILPSEILHFFPSVAVKICVSAQVAKAAALPWPVEVLTNEIYKSEKSVRILKISGFWPLFHILKFQL